jgi:hypothetical protein
MRRFATNDTDAIAAALKDREPFETFGALSGTPTAAAYLGHPNGRLPADWRCTLQAREHVVDYVVYSYATPIAWHDREAGWVAPDERYSTTSSRHQSRVAFALYLAGEEAVSA